MIEIELVGSRGGFTLQARFTAPPQGVTAVFGASGAGKSTLLDLLAGHLAPDRGRVVIAGRVVLDTAQGINLPAAERHIGWVPQDGLLFPHLDVAANLRFGAKRRRQAARLQEARVIDTLGIGHLLDRWPAQLSGGERQRVALGRALLANLRYCCSMSRSRPSMSRAKPRSSLCWNASSASLVCRCCM